MQRRGQRVPQGAGVHGIRSWGTRARAVGLAAGPLGVLAAGLLALSACGGGDVRASGGPEPDAAPLDLELAAPPPRDEAWEAAGRDLDPVPPAPRSDPAAGAPGGSSGPGPDDGRREGPAPAALGAGTPGRAPTPTSAGGGLDDDLQAAVAAEIARARRKAESRSKGRVRGDQCVVAVHVRDLATGRDLVAIRSREALRPASNLKVLTVAATLATLGLDGEFLTEFRAHGDVAAGVLRGDLVARAGGDPLYDVHGDGSLDRWLDDLAEQLLAAGVRRVTGDLVLDEGDFVVPGPGPAWPSSREHWKEYCALSGGFSANAGCVTANVEAGSSAGRDARVRVRPRDHGLPPRIDVSTGRARTGLNVAVEARPGRLVVRGKIPADVSSWSTRFAHPDPVELFGSAVRAGLERRGVRVEGEVRRERGAAAGPPLATLRTPVRESLLPVLRDSNNSVADQLFWTVGHRSGEGGDRPGALRAGRTALARLLAAHGPEDELDLARWVAVDGSGLSRDDRSSARLLTSVLFALLRSDPAVDRALRECLPRAGEDARLSGRMRGTAAEGRVLAKTGFIAGTSGLTGLVEGPDGRTLVFSILVNYPSVDGLNTAAFKPMQDAICARLAEHLLEDERR